MSALSPAQQGLFIGHELAGDKALYNTAECFVFSGKADAGALAAAIAQTVRETECLSSHYQRGADGQGLRLPAELTAVLEHQPMPIPATVEGVRAWAWSVDLPRAFDLAAGLPCRFVLFAGTQQDILYMAVHHVALDGFGYALFCQRLAAVYSALVENAPLPVCPFAPLSELLTELDSAPAEAARPAARDFWLNTLQSKPEAPLFGNEGQVQRGYERLLWTMPQALWQQVTAHAHTAHTTWADVCFAALGLLLYEQSGQQDVALGLPVMNRASATSLRVPCTHMNIVPLCFTVTAADTLDTLAQKVSAEKRRMRKHQAYRYEDMRRDLQQTAPRARIFGPVVNVLPFAQKLVFGPLTAAKEILCAGPVVDLALAIHFSSPKVAPQFEFTAHPASLPVAALADLQADLASILEDWLAEPTASAASVAASRLAKARSSALIGMEPTPAYPHILERIAELARLDPLRIALEDKTTKLSYAELDSTTDRWAAALIARGLPPQAYVGVLLPRSPAAVVAMLAVMKAGACYVPLDAQQPKERQNKMVDILGLEFLIVDANAPVSHVTVAHQFSWQDLHTAPPPVHPLALPSLAGLAYILFTSGSSGEPKGVAITLASLSCFVAAANTRYGLTRQDRTLQFAPLHFDTSLEEVFLTLGHGACLVLRDNSYLDSFRAFAALVDAAQISVLDLPTAYWHEWVGAIACGQAYAPGCVRTLILGGEAVHPAKLRQWLASSGKDVRLINSYGPTETTIVATTVALTTAHADLAFLPIGEPLPGVGVLVLDRAGRPAAEGELHILGPTVGSHYLGHQAPLRREVAVGTAVYPAYATGDLVRREGALLLYIGRLDHELKISGHRIHPHEVEAQLLLLPGVTEACVQGIAGPEGHKRLAAFVAGPPSMTLAGMRQALQVVLPPVLVPTMFTCLDALPKNSSGKIDRRALAKLVQPSALQPTSESASLFEQVRSVWSAVLGNAAIKAGDHFYSVGGQSLQSIEIAVRLSAVLGRLITVADVLSYPVLGDFCAHLADTPAASISPLRTTALSQGVEATSPKLFMLPGVAGTSAQFLGLAQHLSGRVHTMGIEQRFIPELEQPVWHTVAGWALAYADYLCTEFPAPTYRLLGHSYGGTLALETALILEKRGRQVELWLLDSYFHLDRSQDDVSGFLQRYTEQGSGVDPRLVALQLECLAHYRPSGRFGGRAWRCYAAEATRYPPDTLQQVKQHDDQLFAATNTQHILPGHHNSMLSGDHAAVLGDFLLTCLALEGRC